MCIIQPNLSGSYCLTASCKSIAAIDGTDARFLCHAHGHQRTERLVAKRATNVARIAPAGKASRPYGRQKAQGHTGMLIYHQGQPAAAVSAAG